MAREAGIEERIKPVLKVAEQFFLTPPALLAGHDGLDALLDEAYLAHRLVEEVNDRYIAHFGQALIPLDTTVANLVAHQLIGEPFANRLDEAVHHAVENMLDATTFDADSARAYRENLKNPRVVAAWQQWPCLSKQLGVELSRGGPPRHCARRPTRRCRAGALPGDASRRAVRSPGASPAPVPSAPNPRAAPCRHGRHS